MKKRNKQKMYNPCTLDKLVKANKQIQKLKKELTSLEKHCEHLRIAEATSYRRWKKCQILLGTEQSKVEYLKFVVLNLDNMTDIIQISKAKDEYRIWEKRMNEQAQKDCNQFSEELVPRGKHIRLEA
jgi:hypothetical protein